MLPSRRALLLIGFSGELLNSENVAPQPIAALALARPEAHQVLRLLRSKAELAGWNLQITAQWMKPLEGPRAGGELNREALPCFD